MAEHLKQELEMELRRYQRAKAQDERHKPCNGDIVLKRMLIDIKKLEERIKNEKNERRGNDFACAGGKESTHNAEETSNRYGLIRHGYNFAVSRLLAAFKTNY